MTKNKKFFNLIRDGSVAAAPLTKVIPASQFSDLVTAKEVLTACIEDAEKYRQEIIEECEKLKEQAVKEGFEGGYEAWVKQLRALEEEIKRVHDEVHKLIIPVALKAAKKIVAGELEISKDAIVNIVINTLKAVKQHKKIVLYVSKQDFEALDQNKAKIKELFESLESFSLRERDDVEPGGCVIETEGGIINAQIQDRWRSLEAAFEALGEQMKK